MRHRLGLGCAGMFVACASLANAATVTGTVKGPDNAPFAGAFVQAQNTQTKMTVSVLSDRQGQFRVPQLPAGEYQILGQDHGTEERRARPRQPERGSVGAAGFHAGQDRGPVERLSLYQGRVLLPDGKGKKALFANCFACHGFETRMAANTPHDARNGARSSTTWWAR